MKFAGTTSWRFAESDRDEMSHVALFIRDALGLPVLPGPAVPPPLSGTIPDHRGLLSTEERKEAGQQWTDWWATVLGFQVQMQEEPADPGMSAVRETLQARREQAGSPPDFAALADRPALQRAAVETFPHAHRWVNQLSLEQRDERKGSFPYRLVRQVAEDVAFDRRVDFGAVRASAVVLEVKGSWWHLLAPGAVVCSDPAAADPTTGELILRRAFESSLRR
ncbi:hypothetical protein O2V63_02655 [Modestobacter sp. VKM Ac-2977]|uniref:hypothetical protein n=1 Tax=Modestobacter sp. VKM Ac-2977 TaxID=3004131 RepID=UPI0022AAB354|nr:hypothetical protein [Modestobacter sp. VKM Ac-2977]MCZ2819226.1 hypothetical protein [Modestobacter sp. VKM Ac-2977]